MESTKEKRIRNITQLYYSRKDIQEAIFQFSKDREVSPRYFEGFGKRPDSFQYKSDIFELVKKGATSFHCSEEIWHDPLKISTGLSESQLNELRKGWDLLIDIDCNWIDYSKKAAEAIIKTLNKNGVKNIGIKFSGSKGFHIIVPWKSFPKEINDVDTSELFPELPRKIVSYLRFWSEKEMKESLPEDFYSQFKNTNVKRGIKCNTCSEIADKRYRINFYCESCGRKEMKLVSQIPEKVKCPECNKEFSREDPVEVNVCQNCKINSLSDPDNFSRSIEVDLFDLMGLDLVLVSPRHLFRMPYSLHEKTALSSVVIEQKDLAGFDLKDASPMRVSVKNFYPEPEEGEASELVLQALDWSKENEPTESLSFDKRNDEFQPLRIDSLSDKHFPPSVKKILEGVGDGRKRALFILINFFRSIGMEKGELEKRVYEWNKKNEVPLKEGYIRSQISWSYRNKIVLPPNYNKDYYKAIGVIPTDEELRLKNPVNFTRRKVFGSEKPKKNKKKK